MNKQLWGQRKILCMFLGLFAWVSLAQASVVAILDSGVDFSHPFLSPYALINWPEVNGQPTRDEDQNGLPDDFNGWNFVINTNLIFNQHKIHSFTPNVFKFMEYRRKKFLGLSLTAMESLEFAQLQANPTFLHEYTDFTVRYGHGTAVAGVIAKNNPQVKLLSFTIFPDSNNEPQVIHPSLYEYLNRCQSKTIEEYVDLYAEYLNRDYTTILNSFARQRNIDVINGSYAFNEKHSFESLAVLYFALRISPESIDAAYNQHLARRLLRKRIEHLEQLAAANPRIVFVFAAGNFRDVKVENSGNLDSYLLFPASAQADNIITVAAFDEMGLSSYSNYGRESVDVAAPAEIHISTYPNNLYGPFNGTSAAAPYVSALASRIRDINPQLTGAQIKEIILKTAIPKLSLRGMLKQEALIEGHWAQQAAHLSLRVEVNQAISHTLSERDNLQHFAAQRGSHRYLSPSLSPTQY